jgi:membrane protein
MRIILYTRKYLNKIIDDDVMNWSGNLSFLTIFSIVPMMFLTLWIMMQLPFVEFAINDIRDMLFRMFLPGHSLVMVEYLESFVGNVNALGTISLFYMLVTAILFFRSFEQIVSKIFGIPKMSLIKSIFSFFGLIFLLIFSMAMFVLIKAFLDFELFELLFIWFLFFMVFKMSVNTKIYTLPAIKASLISSFVWYGFKSLFIYYIVYNKLYATLYGSISVIFFIFIWIFLSWYILLFGFKILKYFSSKIGIIHI